MTDPVVTCEVIQLECGHIFYTNNERETIECPLCAVEVDVEVRKEIEFQGEPPHPDELDEFDTDQSETES